MERKAALIGSNIGPLVRTSGMRNLHANLRVSMDTVVVVEQYDHNEELKETHTFVGAGIKRIADLTWTRIRIVDGSCADALCLLQTSG